MKTPASFQPELFNFFRDLSRHNDRDWFLANRGRYESFVKTPTQIFVAALGQRLRKLSLHVNDGKVMRINRDIRFSPDKRPYKTNVGAHFAHPDAAEGASAGFYIHLAPGEVFLGSGLWSPDTATQNRIRTAIVDRTAQWKKITRAKDFPGLSSLHAGDSLKRPPRGYDPEHPFVEDLKRRHFVATSQFSEKDAVKPGFLDEVGAACKTTAPLVAFLNQALDLRY